MLNCAGGMNNKAIVDDWRIKLVFPLLLFIDFLLKQKGIASFIFERVRKRFSSLCFSLHTELGFRNHHLYNLYYCVFYAERVLKTFYYQFMETKTLSMKISYRYFFIYHLCQMLVLARYPTRCVNETDDFATDN